MDILGDFKTSLTKSLDEIDPAWKTYDGLIVAGTHTPKNVDELLEKIKEVRELNKPFLGICFGFQLMLIEYARNVLKVGADTTEINPETPWPVFTKLDDTRVGAFPVKVNGETRLESHWHNYAFNQQYISWFKDKFILVWSDGILEMATLRKNKYHLGTQFHPEYESSIKNPHPILKEFLRICSVE